MFKKLIVCAGLLLAAVACNSDNTNAEEMDPISLTAYNQILEYQKYVFTQAEKMKGADQTYKDTWKVMKPKVDKWTSEYAGKVDLKQHQWLEWWAITVSKKTLENPAELMKKSFENFLRTYKGKFPNTLPNKYDSKLANPVKHYVLGHAFQDLSENKDLDRFNMYINYYLNEPGFAFDFYYIFLQKVASTESSENWNVEELKGQIIAAAEKYGNFTPKLIETLKSYNADGSNPVIGVQGKSFVPFSGPDLDGNTISVSDYKGKVLLVDFWATWCGPCMKKVPELVALHNKYRDQGFEILGVSGDYEDEIDNVISTVEENGMSWPNIYDNGVKEAQTLNDVSYIPYTILLDKTGKARYFDLHGERLAGKIEELLAETEEQANNAKSEQKQERTDRRSTRTDR
ncbi:TlpA disulfide reductase family protein [Porticoccaceae bacterium LTM1]|nr:TlpA disulfide reductase family protein [Porticoccaceae bacterium LTM1]